MLRRLFSIAVFPLLMLFALPLTIPLDTVNRPPGVALVDSPELEPTVIHRVQLVMSELLLPRSALAQESASASAAPETRSHSALFWLAVAAVVAAVFFGGRYLYRKYMAEDAYPRQRSP